MKTEHEKMLSKIIKNNPLFFNKEAKKFHGDIDYRIVTNTDGNNMLEVRTYRGHVYYSIDENKYYKLTYKNSI